MLADKQPAHSDEEPNVVLAPDEIATLSSLMGQYDQLLEDMDNLNLQLESLLKAELPPSEVSFKAPNDPTQSK